MTRAALVLLLAACGPATFTHEAHYRDGVLSLDGHHADGTDLLCVGAPCYVELHGGGPWRITTGAGDDAVTVLGASAWLDVGAGDDLVTCRGATCRACGAEIADCDGRQCQECRP